MKKTNPKTILRGSVVSALLIFFVVAFWQGLTIKHYAIQSDKIAAPVRLAVIADLHSTRYGDEQKVLIKAIRKQNPDIILLVGDIADDEVPHDGTRQLLAIIGTEYPCYYVAGNHEHWTDEIDSIKKMISSYGVTIFEGKSQTIAINNQKIILAGVDDPEGFRDSPYVDGSVRRGWKEQFENCRAATSKENYSILLTHRPEMVEHYRNSGFDLVVAGHTHGGQVRIPGLLNGLIAPNQGFFPHYAGGCYQLGTTTMIVSRGLSRSRLPRVFNPPELVMVELR